MDIDKETIAQGIALQKEKDRAMGMLWFAVFIAWVAVLALVGMLPFDYPIQRGIFITVGAFILTVVTMVIGLVWWEFRKPAN